MGKIIQKVKSVLKSPKRSRSLTKQIDRWEGEGGAIAPDEQDEIQPGSARP